MKRLVTLVVILLLVTSSIAGCGISQDIYDTAIEEIKALKTQLSDTQTDLSASESKFTSTQSELSTAKTDLATVRQTLTEMTADYDSIKTRLDAATADLISTQADLGERTAELQAVQQSLDSFTDSVSVYEAFVEVAVNWLNARIFWYSWDTATQQAFLSTMDAALLATEDALLKSYWDVATTVPGFESSASSAFTTLLLERLAETKPNT